MPNATDLVSLGEKSNLDMVMSTLKKKRGVVVEELLSLGVLESSRKTLEGVGDLIILKKSAVSNDVVTGSVNLACEQGIK